MITVSHVILSPQGLHARPIAQLCRCALDHASAITVATHGNEADARDMVALMGLDARAGDELIITVEGPDEEPCAAAVRELCATAL